jgi:crossover junction endodeoxyribonuclease RuvC
MNIMGLDLSLTRTGYALPDGSYGVLVPPNDVNRGMPRLRWIRNTTVAMAKLQAVDLVVIEGYAMGMGREAQNHAMGELGGVVRLGMFDAGVRYVDVAPATLKRYATGKGNANKELVLVEAVKRLGYQGSDNNEADALWLRQMGLAAYLNTATDTEFRMALVPALNRNALLKVQWPQIEEKILP